MQIAAVAHESQILAALDARERERLIAVMERVPLVAGEVLCEVGRPQRFATFPISGLVAINYVTTGGATSAMALVGNEGFIGISLFLSGATTLLRAEVVADGQAWRVPADALSTALKSGGALQSLALHHVQALTIQMAQTAVCNRHHHVQQQLSRWLLLAFDRVTSDQLHLTQEQLANLLGVRREGITEAAGRLQDAGAIRYARGQIHLLDRGQLQAHACECYGVVRGEYDRQKRLLPGVAR